MRARDTMTSPVQTVWQNASVESAAEQMTAKSITTLPVVDTDGRLVGMVSEGDLLWHRVPAEPTTDPADLPDTDPEHRPGMVVAVMSAYRLDEYADGNRRWTATVEGGVATVAGEYDNDTERAVVGVLARTVPGVAAVRVTTPATS